MRRGIKTALIWVLLLGGVFAVMMAGSDRRPSVTLSASRAQSLVDGGQVRTYRLDGPSVVLITQNEHIVEVHPPLGDFLERLEDAEIPYEAKSEPSALASWAPPLLMMGLLVGLFVFIMRRMGKGVGYNIFELRKSKARNVEASDKAKFTDIGGNRDAVELLADVVDFLRAPDRWTSSGVRIPRGILVVGPPGTGKTLLARAVAGETNSTFLYTSATEFVELFVGVGAARVRDTFEKALAKPPAVVFIDELDAIGRRRGSGTGTIHEEREQTLNQLLVLLDGMERHTRLVVMAATNRPDVLDAALLRPGRFDRMLRLELPTPGERLDILKIHVRGKPIDPALSLERIAGQTDGFSGADLEALTNAAGLLAIRRARGAGNGAMSAVSITNDDFDRARQEMTRANRQFNRLDTIVVESVSQFAEPVGHALARVTLASGATVEGEVQWMNASHMKLRLRDGSEVIVAKDSTSQIESLDGADFVSQNDFTPDRWAGRNIDTA